jgi:DNA-binding CsgD family transcriptional regulator
MTTRQIAETLFVTPKTIEFHLRHAYRKLNVASRAELAELLGRVGTNRPASAGGAVSAE